MRILLSTVRALVKNLKERTGEVAAAALLEEALTALNAASSPHWWSGKSIAEVPEMIRELARDRDDFKTMASAYRDDLAAAEGRIRLLERELAQIYERWSAERKGKE